MCDPVTMTTLAVVAGGLSAYSQIEQGENANDVAQFNAREMENEAIRTRNKGVEEENIQRQRTAQLKSLQRAQLGASGIDIDSGSAADLQQDTDILGEVDALRIRRNFQDQAESLDRQSDLTLQQGKRAKRAGYVQALGTVLTTGATLGMSGAGSATAAGSTSAGSVGSVGSAGGVSSKWYNAKSALVTGGI